MNLVILAGNLTRDVEKKTDKVYSFSLAVKRGKTDKTDFINCQAWEGTGSTIAEFFHKGDKIMVVGEWHTNKKDTTTYHVCNVTRFEFMNGSKSSKPQAKKNSFPESYNDFDISSEDMPF